MSDVTQAPATSSQDKADDKAEAKVPVAWDRAFVRLVSLLVLIAAAMSLHSSAREALPAIAVPRLVITAGLPGAAAPEVARELAAPIEGALEVVDAIESVDADVFEQYVVVTVDCDMSLDAAGMALVRTEVERALARVQLPAQAQAPQVHGIDPSRFPVLELGVSAGPDTAPEDFAQRAQALARAIEASEGAGRVQIAGLRPAQALVRLRPEALARNDIHPRRVIRRLRAALAGGTTSVRTSTGTVSVGVLPDLTRPADLASFEVGHDEWGESVSISDLASVDLAPQDLGYRLRVDGRAAITLLVHRKADQDIITVAQRARELALEAAAAQELELVVLNDASARVRTRLGIMVSNGLGGLALLVLVLILFVDLRVALWIAFGALFSLAAVAAILPLLGISINMVSLAAMILAVGLIVDDAIVVAERIARLREDGVSAIEASRRGVREMWVPVAASSLTTVIAFVPMTMLGGLPGKFAASIPIVVTIALLMSLVECLVILPGHLAHLERAPRVRSWHLRLEARYLRLLDRCMARPRTTVALVVLAIAATVPLLPQVGMVLFPRDDVTRVHVQLEMPAGSTVDDTVQTTGQLAEQIQAVMGASAASIVERAGHEEFGAPQRDYGGGPNLGSITVRLESLEGSSAAAWLERLRGELAAPEGANLDFQIDSVGPPLGKPVQVSLRSTDPEALPAAAEQVRAWLAAREDLRDVRLHRPTMAPGHDLDIDATRATLNHVEVDELQQALALALRGVEVGHFEGTDQSLRVGVDDGGRGLDGRLALALRLPKGEVETLVTFVDKREVVRPTFLHRLDGQLEWKLSATPSSARVTPIAIAGAIESELLPALPAQVDAQVRGEAVHTRAVIGDMPGIIGVAILGVLAVLVLVTRSLAQAGLILLGVPLGMVGVTLAFYVHGLQFSAFALLGVVALAGIVVNDSLIVVVAMRRAYRAQHADRAAMRQALLHAAAGRLRPVLMTSLTTLVALGPLAYGIGGSDALVGPMALAIAYGLFVATGVSLLVVPVLIGGRRL